MSAGYVIAQLKVTNSENYKEYVNKVTEIVKKFDGEYLVRNGEYQSVEGEIKFPRLVVIKFPTYEKALEWYNSDEYQPIKKIRLVNANTNGIIIQGA
jgi:uncharacterized protein (DUF1330 family)